MKRLEEFKNKHKNADIYVLASGKSVDFVDNSFFENKIIIGTNQVYKKYKCNYLVRKESNFIQNIIQENKNTFHFISKGCCGNSDDKNLSIIKKLSDNEKKKLLCMIMIKICYKLL